MSLIKFMPSIKKRKAKSSDFLNANDISDMANQFIDEALQKRKKNEQKRSYLGASMIGEPCLRKIQYIIEGKEQDMSGKGVRILDLGHLLEEKIASWLNESGFVLKTKNTKGAQYGFSIAEGEIAGHIDGIVKRMPDKMLKQLNEKLSKQSLKVIDKDCNILWECKTLNSSSWKDTKKHGIFVSKPTYYVQVQLYMAYMNFDYTLFTAFNKDTAEFYHEIVPFDAEDAQMYSDKAVKLLLAKRYKEVQPKISEDQNFYLCKMCIFKNLCHNMEEIDD